MKRSLLFLPIVVLVSCASVPPPEAELVSRAQAFLDGPSHPLPVELTIDPDFVSERVTLVRTVMYRPASNGMPEVRRENDDSPLGVSLGNGLYLDNLNNLSIRVDRVVRKPEREITEFWAHDAGKSGGKRVEYTDEETIIHDPALFGAVFKVGVDADSTPVSGGWLIRLDNGFQLNALPPSSLVTTKRGVRKSYSLGLELTLGGQRVYDLRYSESTVTDQDKTFVVENHGDYVGIRYALGSVAAYRLYRTATTTVVINEADGSMIVFRDKDDTLEWQRIPAGAPVGEFHAQGRLTRSPL